MPEVGAGEFVVEEKLDIGQVFKLIEENFVQRSAVSCEQCLGLWLVIGK